ncbi:glycosyltransferase family 2 protein [Synechococcus sp. CBW1004]|uniref:glycosyltransferase n=1 Tax=Synechococcus sp. CBW1004 TaxID=1353136 RepID=UPI0018CFB291|nr:glycosyltransferase [Synechococcus sp. CBW1004]QPN63427.1 glycosyltransferase [Synechococcus sp. CBW1004]
MAPPSKPLISIAIEAYNEEANNLSPPVDTIAALCTQDFPLELVELILIGSPRQFEYWGHFCLPEDAFWNVHLLPISASNAHYWQLKNEAAKVAQADYLAFIDCDCLPGPRWLPALAEALRNGADVSVGFSQYRTERLDANSALMLAAALPSWGFVLARRSTPQAGALVAHNFAIRRDLMLRHKFSTLKHSFPSSLLYFDLLRSGARFSFQPDQRVAHGMTFRWWLTRMHFRRGWETYIGRQSDPDWPRIKALEQIPLIEPIILRFALVCRDARHWFRYSHHLGLQRTRALCLFPLAVVASLLARSAEMAGMYAALLAPDASANQARF